MTRTSLESFNCSLARAAEVVGDKWTLLILRDAFYGIRSFSDFKARLGIAPAVLSDRLNALCAHQILERMQSRPDVDRHAYRLTARGRDLFVVVVSLAQWGDKWMFGPGQEPVRIMDRATLSPIQPVAVQARDGHVIEPREAAFEPGPGANAATLREFDRLADGTKPKR